MTSQGVTVWKSKHKVENISASNDAKQVGKHVVHYEMRHMMHILMLLWQQSCYPSLSAVNQLLPL